MTLSESTSSLLTSQSAVMSDINSQLINKRKRNHIQQNAIKQKQNVINTRGRMLQIAKENNMYKQKVIYTLIAFIFTIIIIMIFMYGYFTRKAS